MLALSISMGLHLNLSQKIRIDSILYQKGKMYQRRDIVEGSSPNGSQKVVTKYFLKILPKNRKVLEIQDFCVRVQF